MLLALGQGTQALYAGLSPVTTEDASYSMPLSLVLTQKPLISHGTHSAKVMFFKSTAVVVIVNLAQIKDYEEQTEGGVCMTN